jgi:hypothetical protein
MSRLPTPNLVPSAVLLPRTVLGKIMLHLPRQRYSIGSTAASPGGLAIAALAPVFLPERYSDLGQCMYELLSAWGLISQFGFCMEAHPSDN